MPATGRRINMICPLLLRHGSAITSGLPGKFGVEIGTEDEFQFFQQPGALGRPAAIEIGGPSPRDVRPCRQHPPASTLGEFWKRFGKNPVEVVDQGAAKFARQTVKAGMCRTTGKNADEGRGFGLE